METDAEKIARMEKAIANMHHIIRLLTREALETAEYIDDLEMKLVMVRNYGNALVAVTLLPPDDE